MISITYVAMLLGLVCLLGLVAHRWRVRRVFMRGTEALAKRLGETEIALEEARTQKERYFEVIASMEKQRNDWHLHYVEQSIGHGNAQNLMMDTIDAMGRKLSEHGIKFKIPRVLHEVRAEFLETHEMPARHEAEKLGEKKTDPPLAS